jgi:hypothetical protein
VEAGGLGYKVKVSLVYISKFQTSLAYIIKPCVIKSKNKNKEDTKLKYIDQCLIYL